MPGGGKANFIVYYELDDEEVKHFLSLDSYGVEDRWVLLARARRVSPPREPACLLACFITQT